MSSSIGVFREGEIDGEPFHIYTLLFQTDKPSYSSSSPSSGEASIDSGGCDDLSPPTQTLFICPNLRIKAEKLKREENGYSNDDMLPFDTSAHFPNIRSVNQLFDSDSHSSTCKHQLDLICTDNDSNFCFVCLNLRIGGGTRCYICVTCDETFHKECAEAPLEIKHPSYPFSSLQLYTNLMNTGWMCISCGDQIHNIVYHCPTYNLKMHPDCAMKPIPILINHPKRHPHPLTFFPKQNSLSCNVCGVIKVSTPTYVCARSVFVVHLDCIYSPYVIRISRHEHRISFIYFLPSRELSCHVCRRKLDNDYGAYSCSKCDNYFVHSRCALRRDLWDGEELEGVPEEPEIVVDPFKTISDGVILHFSHGHHLKLEISSVYDDDNVCQACILPIYEGGYYSCVDQCDFILHEACANYPLKKHHPLHAHPLMLKAVTNEYQGNHGYFRCDACRRESCGFVFEDPTNDFRLDLRCASISEPFEYQGHEHPLFLALTPEEEESAVCKICQDTGTIIRHCRRKLNCIECDYIICFECATLPYKARYKHEKHLLTFREGKEANDESGWCEVCERKMVYSIEKGFYACDDYCCTTLHVDCLLGKDPYMKPGQTIKIVNDKVRILRNNMSRPFCQGHKCDEDRCLYRVCFVNENVTFCSFICTLFA